ncbi:SusC/RagA family TonB-linked outer membrane protein [Polaribacter cellanae]|uniref:SusC/RagA family TonB-linked outer membrane protein n=1 Tax=Polaribacter cellanae TaxID=2818493 RepID=A0A975H940_9FLAO|nr:SusC/RagA family TonB-linked outer membrane protein [Polaribacter cellanae]QTE22410.1 SusC/RagA family TonB-linked outer membrane protein [Polaribacter cellanae]
MKIKIFCLFFCLTIGQVTLAQKKIEGVVTDKNNSPLLGASVILKGTTNGTQTDFDGNFSLNAKKGEILVVQYLGYSTKEIQVTTETKYKIVLEEEQNSLSEIVVVGYGTRKKTVLTSSVVSIKGEELAKEPVLNATQALQGKAAGVQIIASDAPGQASKVIIRGLGTVLGNENPLYVVDGILTDNINNINTSDIATMNVLKDASALAIYGNRASNGVLIITTKKGKKGKIKLTFDTFTGARSILNKVKLANSNEFITYSNEAILRDLQRDDDATNDNDKSDFILSGQPYNTNWLDAITRVGRVSNYNISASGGSEKIRGFFSAGFNKEEGILIGNDFNRLTLRSNIDYELNSKLNFSNSINVQLANSVPKNFNAFTTAYKQSPTIPIRDKNGAYGSSIGINNVGNPVKDLDFQDEKQRYFKVQGTFKVNYKILESLSYTSAFSIETEYARFHTFEDRLGSFLANNPSNSEQLYFNGNADREKTFLSVRHTNKYHWFIDNYLTYNKTFNDIHNFNATIGTSSEEDRSEELLGTAINVPLNKNLRYNLNNGDNNETRNSSGGFSPYKRLNSYFARINYDYKNKYLLGASFRRDGSSQFKKDFKFGNFYAISAGWIVTKEKFMEDSFFDKLKLRAGYGEVGNQNVPLQIVTLSTGDGGFYPFGANQNLNQGTTISSTLAENLSWETTKELNFGAEFTLFDYKLSGEVDFYIKKTSNAILQIKLPDVFGIDPYLDHIGEIENKGIETTLNWQDEINDNLKYNVGLNFALNKNKLTKVTNPYFNESIGGYLGNGQYTKRVRVGQPVGSFFLYDVIGIDDKGEFVYDDVNNNGITDEGDRKFMGSFIPKYNIGFNFGFNYKNFDLAVDTYTSLGAKVYNGKRAQRFGNENIEQSVFNNRWTSGRPSNTGRRAFNEVPLSSNYYLESADFFRVNNITLGYTLKENTTSFFNRVRIYATAKNPFIVKKFSGFTAELPGGALYNAGIELSAYPTLRSFFIGINTSF